MADKVTTKNTLSLEMKFSDGDTRTITIDNPKATIAAAAINSIAAQGVVVGDKTGADFLRFETAKITRGTTTYLDLTD